MVLDKKIVAIVFSFVILGVLSNVVNMFDFNILIKQYLGYTSIIQLDFVEFNFKYIFGHRYSFSVLNSLFYLLLLYGGILYVIFKGKEHRLILFTFSIALIFKVTLALLFIFSIFRNGVKFDSFYGAVNLITFIVTVSIIIYLLYFVISKLSKLNSVKKGFDSTAIEFKFSENECSKWTRFVNMIIDGVVFFVLFFYIYKFASFAFNIVTVENNIYYKAFSLFVYFVYYLFFESIFNTTSAKFLTGTRVLTNRNLKPSFGSILKRTFARFIPFNQLSFLMAYGWHDSLSETKVVKLEETGMKKKFFTIFLISFFIVYGISVLIIIF